MTKTTTKLTAGKLMAGTAAVLLLGAPMVAPAQTTSPSANANYDGYCYAKSNNAKTTGTVVGAVAGAAAGSQVSKNEKGLGAIIGAVAGGALGRTVAASGIKCLNGEYYSYQSGYYEPLSAPEGYSVVYYKQRPTTSAYSVVYYDTQRHTQPGYAYNNTTNGQPFNGGYQSNSGTNYNNGNNTGYTRASDGWKDDKGTWHTGRPVALGWKDDRGYWYEGQVASYGYKDTRGAWHEETAPSYGYNNN